ncbi:MAG: AraC family transcriptional regulator [Clostridia bacterium]
MKVSELIKNENINVYCYEDDAEIMDYYCGDLLSWVMGRATEGSCWFTIMSNINVCAVAKLLNFACVILCEGVKADEKLLERANKEKITVLGTKLTIYNAVKTFVK